MTDETVPVSVWCKGCGQVFSTFLEQMADHNAEVVCPNCGKSHERPQSGLVNERQRSENLNLMLALKYCPNGECVSFQCEVETSIARCRLCGWEMQLVKQQSDSAKEGTPTETGKLLKMPAVLLLL
jgi:hypothetical protein